MNPESVSPSTLISITREGMGHADPPLQMQLLTKYLTLLENNGVLPGAICLYSDGVKLAVEGSPVAGLLQSLEEKGVRLILCKTCLDYFGIADRVAAGIVGGMPDIITAQWAADKVIHL